MTDYKPGDKVRITNGAWSNAKTLEHYGKIAEVREVDRHYVQVAVRTSIGCYLMVDKPLNEIEPYEAVARLAGLTDV